MQYNYRLDFQPKEKFKSFQIIQTSFILDSMCNWGRIASDSSHIE